jgi:hypothetical protein
MNNKSIYMLGAIAIVLMAMMALVSWPISTVTAESDPKNGWGKATSERATEQGDVGEHSSNPDGDATKGNDNQHDTDDEKDHRSGIGNTADTFTQQKNPDELGKLLDCIDEQVDPEDCS